MALGEVEIKKRVFAAAVDGIRKTAFNDALHVEVQQDGDKAVAVVRCKSPGKETTYIKITASVMMY
jgi:hypothetical protein